MSGVLTDAEIIKGCKSCLHYEACKGTYYSAKGDEDTLHEFEGEMYGHSGCENFESKDLINRLKAKNKALRMDKEQLESDVINANMNCEHLQAEIKRLEKVQVQYVKAYFDEFAERLKNDFRLAQLDIGLTSAVVDELVDTMNSEFENLEDFTALIESKAVKLFAERLKDETFKINYCGSVYNVVDIDDIDNLAKERVGES